MRQVCSGFKLLSEWKGERCGDPALVRWWYLLLEKVVHAFWVGVPGLDFRWPFRMLCPPPGSLVTTGKLLSKLNLSFHIGKLGKQEGLYPSTNWGNDVKPLQGGLDALCVPRQELFLLL